MRSSTFIPARRNGFTLVEVLVVISIIVVLAGILLVALGSATESAKRAKTTTSLASFRAACDSFALDHNFYPGVVPASALDGLRLTSTQNALLHLMGGYRVYNAQSPAGDQAQYNSFRDAAESESRPYQELVLNDPATGLDWYLLVVPTRMGEGPVINGKPYSPYFAPRDSELVFNTTGSSDYTSGLNTLPNFVDAWGTPVLYYRQERSSGPMIAPSANESGMFPLTGQNLYLNAERLGDLGYCQAQTPGPGSRLDTGPSGINEPIKWLTLLLSHPAFYDPDTPTYGTARSKYMVMSAGQDGVYMARNDGPVDENGAFDYDHDDADHDDLGKFDDIVIYGGG